jgi:SAM-dependent methyltransferase
MRQREKISARPLAYSEVRYLHAKSSVDDRALNRTVLDQLRGAIDSLPQPLRILELGAGVGTMISRLADMGWIARGSYTLLDRDQASLRSAGEHLLRWAGSGAFTADDRLTLGGAGRDLRVHLVQADIFDWLARSADPPFDLVVANAFLDLVDVPALLPPLWRRLGPGRPFWFSINFDGETIFLPELPLDGAITAGYHRTMDERVRDGTRAGESRTGRRLLELVPRSGARIVGAGSSDWVVWPGGGGGYPEDEGYFLHHIVHTIDVALSGSSSLDEAQLAAWIEERHRQIERGQLIYIAHQLDLVGFSSSSRTGPAI